MIVGLLSDLIGYLLVPAIILHFIHHEWFKKYVEAIVVIVYFVATTLAGVAVGLVVFLPTLAKGGMKAAATAVLSIGLVVVYAITFVVPFVGGRIQRIEKRSKQSLYPSDLIFEVRRFRGMMVEIVAEHDERDLDFKNSERYREELSQVEDDAKIRLETGETVLSIFLGLGLIATRITGSEIFQMSLYNLPVSLFIEAWLLAIAISIIYRVSVLEFLAFSADDEFGSIEEMDAALAYQKGVSLVGIVQGLTVVVVFVSVITNVKFDIVRSVLEVKYSENLWINRWLPLAWKSLQDRGQSK